MYNRYSDFLRKKYGAKVYKLPVNLPVSCPNRLGQDGSGGCIYCGQEGAGFDSLPPSMPVCEQLAVNADKMRSLYKAQKFIAYFQNYSNTYLPLSQFEAYITEAASFSGSLEQPSEIVEIAVSTRPDCISDAYLASLKRICGEKGICVSIELGLQTVNYHTLEKINRGHSLAEFIDAVLRIKRFGFSVCTHLILNLPWDGLADVIETAKIIGALSVEQVKLHALYILKDTVLANLYEKNEISVISLDEYKERVITFLEYLPPGTVVQRIIGRCPKDSSLFANWGVSWWKIHDDIQEIMLSENRFQAKRFAYLGGSAVKKFEKL